LKRFRLRLEDPQGPAYIQRIIGGYFRRWGYFSGI
jgi:hypothetical protein